MSELELRRQLKDGGFHIAQGVAAIGWLVIGIGIIIWMFTR